MANVGRTTTADRIDVDRVTNELQQMVSSDDDNNCILTSSSSIFRVPNILRRHNPEAYQPNSFSIGPFHHDKEHLRDSQQIKVHYLKALLRRAKLHNNVKLKNLIGAVRQIQDEAWSCYAGLTDMRREAFVKILVLDSCFLIELFLREFNPHLKRECISLNSTF